MAGNRIRRRDVLQLGAALAAGGLAPAVLRSSDRKAGFDWKLRAPEDAGMSSAGLEGIRAAIQKNIDANVIPGAVTAVARHNKLVWYEAQGVGDIATSAPLRPESLFRMMSSTKPLTATAVLMMMEAGKLSLDDKVSRFIPAFKDQMVAVAPPGTKDPSLVKLVPADREITIKDLLTHTSGLSSFGDGISPGPASLVNKIERKPDDKLADYVPRLGAAALDFQPGAKWRYSPLDGFDVLLRIVEIASGKPADVFMRERLFAPLNMRDTYFNVPEREQGRMVTVNRRSNGTWVSRPPMFGNGPHTYFSGAGGLISSARDFMQYEQMLLNRGALNGRRLLRSETVALMSRNHVGTLFAEWIPPITGGMGFGLGVMVVGDESKAHGRAAGAFGWGGAYGTESWADPELDVTATLFIQMDPAPANVKNEFQQAIRKAIVA